MPYYVREHENILATRSRLMLAEGLFRLMERDRYQGLTISQICQEAGMSRQTFYQHYRKKDQVLAWWLQMRFLEKTEKEPDTGSPAENIQRLFEDFPIPKDKLVLLRDQGLLPLLSDSMRDFLESTIDRYQPADFLQGPQYRDYDHALIVSTISTVLSCWIDRDFREGPQELSAIVIRVLT